MTNPMKTDRKVTIGSYIALAFTVVFCSNRGGVWFAG